MAMHLESMPELPQPIFREPHQLVRPYLQDLGECEDAVQGRRSDASLEHRDKGPMQIASVGERLLREIRLLAEFPKDAAEGLAELARPACHAAENLRP